MASLPAKDPAEVEHTPKKRRIDSEYADSSPRSLPQTPTKQDQPDSVPVDIEGTIDALTSIYERYFASAAELLDGRQPQVKAAQVLLTKGSNAMRSTMMRLRNTSHQLINKSRGHLQTISFLREKIAVLEAQLAFGENDNDPFQEPGADKADKQAGADKEPGADKADKEPGAKKADKESGAHKDPRADREPQADK